MGNVGIILTGSFHVKAKLFANRLLVLCLEFIVCVPICAMEEVESLRIEENNIPLIKGAFAI